ncbi:Phosphate acyltransferase [Trichinella spiralis]|uniref:Phosphate acyltransferase n=1 Tax=Trichinella spiralis TaxID=6334 RepID=A0ABR3KJN2_TRISP
MKEAVQSSVNEVLLLRDCPSAKSIAVFQVRRTKTCVTDGGAKRRLQANSEAKRNLIGWADNSQTNAEVTRKFSHEKVIKLDGIWLNLESPHTPNDRNQREAEQECDICLLETVTLPARTEVIVTGKSNANWTTKDGFFEPAPKLVTNHSVMAACSLSRTHRGTVPVRLLNGTDTPITLFKDTKLGTYLTTYSTAKLIENMAKLSHDVPHTIRRRLRTLLWKCKQIIATDEYNTGRTNACKHSINTGVASPIKQPPRRIPYHQKETV